MMLRFLRRSSRSCCPAQRPRRAGGRKAAESFRADELRWLSCSRAVRRKSAADRAAVPNLARALSHRRSRRSPGGGHRDGASDDAGVPARSGTSERRHRVPELLQNRTRRRRPAARFAADQGGGSALPRQCPRMEDVAMNSADAVTWMRSDFRRAPRDSDARPSEEPGGAHEAARELPHLLRALSLDPDALERADDPRLRQMQSTCAGCDRKQRCREDLCLGVAAKRYRRTARTPALSRRFETGRGGRRSRRSRSRPRPRVTDGRAARVALGRRGRVRQETVAGKRPAPPAWATRRLRISSCARSRISRRVPGDRNTSCASSAGRSKRSNTTVLRLAMRRPQARGVPFKRACRNDLCEGRSSQGFFPYGPNAEEIQMLRKQKWFGIAS